MQISYWATSQKLTSNDEYPRFMRTIPNDADVSRAVCELWRDYGYSVAAVCC